MGKRAEVVWVRAILGREVASWHEVWFNEDKHSIYIENPKHIRRAARRSKGRRNK